MSTTSTPRAVRRRRWWRIVRNTVVMLALGGAGYGAIAFQRDYGTWPGLDVKDRINWCGEVYRVAVTDLTLAEVNTDPAHPVEPLFEYPPHLPRRSVLGLPIRPPACPGSLFIRVGSDRYTKFLPGGR